MEKRTKKEMKLINDICYNNGPNLTEDLMEIYKNPEKPLKPLHGKNFEELKRQAEKRKIKMPEKQPTTEQSESFICKRCGKDKRFPADDNALSCPICNNP